MPGKRGLGQSLCVFCVGLCASKVPVSVKYIMMKFLTFLTALFLSFMFDILTPAGARSHAETSCSVRPCTLKEQTELMIRLCL